MNLVKMKKISKIFGIIPLHFSQINSLGAKAFLNLKIPLPLELMKCRVKFDYCHILILWVIFLYSTVRTS